jgi:peptidyl-prolyl cis-trans isomerase A (cyclophilin A)
MKRRDFLISAVALAATPALAQTPAPAPGAVPGAATQPPAELAPPAPGLVRVKISTAVGDILCDLNEEKAPVTVKNFLRYVDSKRYDAATFYRGSRPKGYDKDDFGVVQGGLENRNVYPPIAHEPTTKTGLKHIDGTLSMGRNAPGSANSDFFICIGESKYLDADPSAPGDNLGFAAFGQVVQGMDTVKKILVMPKSATKGIGVMLGEILEVPVKFTARRVTA